MRKFRYLIIALIILADQAAKLAVRCNMQVGESIPVIKNFFSITHISNSGGALSIFEGSTLLLIAVPVLAMAAAVWYMEKHQTAHWSLILAIVFFSFCISSNLTEAKEPKRRKKMDQPNSYTFTIDKENQSTRIDSVLSLLLPETSRSFIQKLIEGGNLLLNGQVMTSKKYKTCEGDRIEIIVPEPEKLSVEPENIPLDIVYEDDDVLVVNKPKGMVVHPAVGNYTGTLVNAIMYHCGDRLSSINGVIRPGIVHRIDKDTSGLLMIAKNNKAHESLSKQLAEHSITRRYKALVYNNFTEDSGTVDAPIGRDPRNRLKQAVTEQNSKRAVTHWTVAERFGRYTLIEARLETGRTHQIRVHMAYIKHPLVGDSVYGPAKQALASNGQMLHAEVLGFVHPTSGEYMEFRQPLPLEFQNLLERLRNGR